MFGASSERNKIGPDMLDVKVQNFGYCALVPSYRPEVLKRWFGEKIARLAPGNQMEQRSLRAECSNRPAECSAQVGRANSPSRHRTQFRSQNQT